jgi:hypothetical protein
MKSSIRKTKHFSRNKKTKKKIKHQITKNLFIQSGGVKFDFSLKIPEHQIPSLINLVSKHANTAKKILYKDDDTKHLDVINRILEFPYFHKYEILIAMLEFPTEYRYILNNSEIISLFNSSIHCRHFISCLNFANASKINYLLDLCLFPYIGSSKPAEDYSIPIHNFIQIIGISRPLYILFLDIDIKEIKFRDIRIKSTDSTIDINLIEIYKFLFNVKHNSLPILEEDEDENIIKHLINIKKLLTLVPLLEENYTYQLSGTKKQIINTGTLYNYILSVLCPNKEIAKLLSTTKNKEIKSLFRELPTVASTAINSLTLDSSLLKDDEILRSLELLFESQQLDGSPDRRNFEFLYLPRLCNTKLPPAPEIFECVIKIQHDNDNYLKIKYNEEKEYFRHIERNYYNAEYDDIASEPDYEGQARFDLNLRNEYYIITDIINNLLVTLNEIPNPSEIGGTLLDIYLTKEIYHKYSNLFDIGVSSAEKLKYNVGNGATIPFSWLKKHPDILYSKFTNHNSKYQDEPEFKIIHEIFHTKIEEPTTKRTVATLTPEESLKFNQDLLNWILKECPILISTLAGDKIEITGCDLSTVEDIIRKIKEIELGKDFVKYEKIHRTKKVRCFRKLKKILGVKNPLVKEKAIVMFYLTHGSEMLDVDVLKAYILLMIRGQENPIRPSLTLIFNDTDFQTTSREPASQFFTEGGAADGPREGDITI